MAGYEVTVEEMAKAASDVDSVNQQSQDALRNLASQLGPLEGTWQGTASVAFRTLMERYQTDSKKLAEALQGISEQLKSSSDSYALQEEESSQSLSNISNVLGG